MNREENYSFQKPNKTRYLGKSPSFEMNYKSALRVCGIYYNTVNYSPHGRVINKEKRYAKIDTNQIRNRLVIDEIKIIIKKTIRMVGISKE